MPTNSARRAYNQQRENAIYHRQIEWRLTFDQWRKIWDESGRWSERGRGADKFCMCRIGDVGPYAIGNVFISTNGENVRDYQHPGKELPVGVRQQTSGSYYATKQLKGVQYHVGTFPTPELARAAYENFSA